MKNSFQFNYAIHTNPGVLLSPSRIEIFSEDKTRNKSDFQKPYRYLDDALLGFGIHLFNNYFRSPLYKGSTGSYAMNLETWKKLNPLYNLYNRYQQRTKALRQNHPKNSLSLDRFIISLRDGMKGASQPWGIDLDALKGCLSSFSLLEEELRVPLLFNFEMDFPSQVIDEMQVLYALLFHLRAIIAMDHNKIPDVAVHEGCTVDPFSDYLPKAEFIVNDAMIYFQFQKLQRKFPIKASTHFDTPELNSLKAWLSPLQASFHQYAHNACQLIDNLPEEFLKALKPSELEDALYLIQMDWLLGSPAGLLFRIREELFALEEGYEKVFWRDLEGHQTRPSQIIQISTLLTEDDIKQHSVAA